MKPTFENLVAVTAELERVTPFLVNRVLKRFFAQVAGAVWATGRANVPGLAAFSLRSRKARRITNPITREWMRLPRLRSVHARVAKAWRTGL